MKDEKEVLNTLSELSGKMLMDKQCIETYAKSLGYDINLFENFENNFCRELYRVFPVTSYMGHESYVNRTLTLNGKVSNKMLFAICNTELYMINQFFHLIDKVDIKNLTIKMVSCPDRLSYTMKVFGIKEIEINTQKNGKCTFFFDEDNFNKIKDVLMYSNEYTDNVISLITPKHKEMFSKGVTYSDILIDFMTQEQINRDYDYINKYLLTVALES